MDSVIKSCTGIVASLALVTQQPAWGGSRGEASVSPATSSVPSPQAAGHRGGVWAGKARIHGFFCNPALEVPARGLVAADGTGYFLVRNTVLHAQLGIPSTFYRDMSGSPLAGTAPDYCVFYPHVYPYVNASIRQQTLDMSWCTLRAVDPDACRSNRLALNYDRSYESGSSLARIAGHYMDTRGQYKGVLTIAGDGYVFMQDPATSCVVNGRVSVINRAYSVYAIKLSYTNCRSPAWSGATFTGLVSYDGGARQLFALMVGTAAKLAAGNMLNFVRQ